MGLVGLGGCSRRWLASKMHGRRLKVRAILAYMHVWVLIGGFKTGKPGRVAYRAPETRTRQDGVLELSRDKAMECAMIVDPDRSVRTPRIPLPRLASRQTRRLSNCQE